MQALRAGGHLRDAGGRARRAGGGRHAGRRRCSTRCCPSRRRRSARRGGRCPDLVPVVRALTRSTSYLLAQVDSAGRRRPGGQRPGRRARGRDRRRGPRRPAQGARRRLVAPSVPDAGARTRCSSNAAEVAERLAAEVRRHQPELVLRGRDPDARLGRRRPLRPGGHRAPGAARLRRARGRHRRRRPGRRRSRASSTSAAASATTRCSSGSSAVTPCSARGSRAPRPWSPRCGATRSTSCCSPTASCRGRCGCPAAPTSSRPSRTTS